MNEILMQPTQINTKSSSDPVSLFRETAKTSG